MFNRAGQPEKAKPFLWEAIQIRERNNEQNELAYSYFYYGANLCKLGKLNESEEWFRKGLLHALKIGNTKQVIDAYQSMYINFKRINKPDSHLLT
jgi:tetratricopeptide (TPR) repeat protein